MAKAQDNNNTRKQQTTRDDNTETPANTGIIHKKHTMNKQQSAANKRKKSQTKHN